MVHQFKVEKKIRIFRALIKIITFTSITLADIVLKTS
jgi:hypothetical protein